MKNETNLPMHPLSDDALEGVSGGIFTMGEKERHNEWDLSCDHYQCALCGCGRRFSDHKDGCSVKNFPYLPIGNEMSDPAMVTFNHCWSCKYIVHGSNYPTDRGDLYCGRSN